MAERFATVSESDLEKLLDDKDAKNTKRVTKTALREKEEITGVLKFVAEARKADRNSYSKSTLNSIRFGLNRHFKSTRDLDIINDPQFTEANKVFSAKCVELKRQGLAKVEHAPPICEEDLQNLYECGVFDVNSPVTLRNKVFFEVML